MDTFMLFIISFLLFGAYSVIFGTYAIALLKHRPDYHLMGYLILSVPTIFWLSLSLSWINNEEITDSTTIGIVNIIWLFLMYLLWRAKYPSQFNQA